MEQRARTPCQHVNSLLTVNLPLAKIDSAAFKKQLTSASLHCDLCDTKMPRLWICLHSNCRAIICNTSSHAHVLKHFDTYKDSTENGYHSVYINPRALTIWCYECGRELNPLDKSELLSPDVRTYLRTVIRSLQGKRNKSPEQPFVDVPASRQSICKLSDHFLNFVKAMWSGVSPIYIPIQLVTEIKRTFEGFQGYGQEDSQEFLCFILDRLHEELPYPPSSISTFSAGYAIENGRKSHGNGSLSHTISDGNHSSKQGATKRSIISDVFEGTLESKIRCLHCKKDFEKEDRVCELLIEIDKKFKSKNQERNGESSSAIGSMFGAVTGLVGIGGKILRLQDCLSAFTATETLMGDNQYECESCGKKRDGQKTLRIKTLPETLCIMLKRFRRDQYFSKIGTYVQFPMEDFDMRPFCKEPADHEEKNEKSTASTIYDLYALIHHKGAFGAGHYVTYAKNPIDKNWYEFDDTFVTRKTPAEVAKVEAYVLFYQKKSLEKQAERDEILTQIEKESGYGQSRLISRLWFNRWRFLEAPGPITNYDFICAHGAINLLKYPKPLNLVVRIPEKVYNRFVMYYGHDDSPSITEADLQSGCPVCEQEARLIDERRKREQMDIASIDTNEIGPGEYWFLISSTWLASWHAFKAGGPIPGPIDNTRFLNANGTPKPHMQRSVHYRGVNERVWRYFYRIYGGGPICVRAVLDLYSQPYYPPQPADRQSDSSNRPRSFY
ncbi:1822_t:CDS:10 [Paraglomus brasilianum]|uniref:1822_t:CDS:1 n=1 Tax=Paraglomus brasilianum TaxID=144538 RepID=A0A9N9F708_9GLOM|nr:1822_t:CDS:10 [Paraglomus brasilianum]